MLGKLVVDGTPEETVPFDNPDERNLVQEVSIKVVQPDQHNDGLASLVEAVKLAGLSNPDAS